MKILKKILKYFLILIIVVVLGFAGLIVYALITDFKPKEQELISLSEKPSILKDSLSITLLTWNIGYAGLDKEMDFFMMVAQRYLHRNQDVLITSLKYKNF